MMAGDLGTALLWLVLLSPWVMLGVALVRPAVLYSRMLLGVPPLMALALALSNQDVVLDVPGLLLGSSFGVNASNRIFVAITAVAWLAATAAVTVAAGRQRFAFCFLLAMAGNLAAVNSLDALSFLAAFAIMSLSAYGLIVEKDDASAHCAGRFYIVFAVIAELLLLTGLIVLADAASGLRLPLEFHTQPSTWALLCVVAGFGIKAGLVPLHLTLPLAYAAAPASGGIALAGAMLNAGVLGWLLWLPLGQFALSPLGSTLMTLGIAGIVLGVGAGLLQRDPRALLAYSSISQLALVTLGVGASLSQPAIWSTMLPVLVLFVLHHALIKTAAFCLSSGVGMLSAWVRAIALLPVLALAGLPWTLGHIGKSGIKNALSGSAYSGSLIGFGLSLASLGTAVLMMRWWVLVKNESHAKNSGLAALVSASFILLGYVIIGWRDFDTTQAMDPLGYLDSLWPTAVGLVLSIIVLRLKPLRLSALVGAIPTGDIAWFIAKLATAVRSFVVTVEVFITKSHQKIRSRIRGLRPPDLQVSGDRDSDATLPAFLLVVLILLTLYVLGFN